MILKGSIFNFLFSFFVSVSLCSLCTIDALALSNDGHWRQYYSAKDFSQPEIQKIITEYKRDKIPEPHLVDKLASYGETALPYMFRLSGERTLRFFFLNPKLGFFGWWKEHPYQVHACEVISQIRSMSAILPLKRVSSDTFLGACARKALFGMKATFTQEEVLEAIRNDTSAGYRLDDYAEMMIGWSDTEAANFLINTYAQKILARYSWDIETAVKGDDLSGSSMKAWERLFQLLAERPVPESKFFIGEKLKILQRMRSARQSEIDDPNVFARHKDFEVMRLREAVKRIDSLLAAMQAHKLNGIGARH